MTGYDLYFRQLSNASIPRKLGSSYYVSFDPLN